MLNRIVRHDATKKQTKDTATNKPVRPEVKEVGEEPTCQNIADATVAYLQPLEVDRLVREDSESNANIRAATRAMESEGIPDRGATRHQIVSAVCEQFPGVPQRFVYKVFEMLRKDAVIYMDEEESKRCGDAVWRVRRTPGAVRGGPGGKNGGSMTQKIEVKDSPGATVNQFIGSSNRASQNQAKEGFLQQIVRHVVRWFSGLTSRTSKPKGT